MTKKHHPPPSDVPTVIIQEDQLTPDMSALQKLDPAECVVMLVESRERMTKLPYHKHKLILVWSAMRHFAEELRGLGYHVAYYEQAASYREAIDAHIDGYAPAEFRVMESAEYGVSDALQRGIEKRGYTVRVYENNMFLSNKGAFAKKAKGKKTLLLESFYRGMRKETGLLMDGAAPEGGDWNYDKENREPPPKDHSFPKPFRVKPDEHTRAVMDLVEKDFKAHYGRGDTFDWPVTREDAETLLDDFVKHRLDLFGPYQDAIVKGEASMYHSLISPLLNIGLLEPLEVCRRVEQAYYGGNARLNSVEGFIRQVIGWREFVYQVYHYKMPGYIKENHFNHDIDVPQCYWDADTEMACVGDAVSNLIEHGINHHIQRLMITGTFALIAGIDPQQVNDWYLEAYADAWEWVVTPNVLGLSLYADGGYLATKPYAASANYVNKMSNCCADCTYNPKEATGDDACPWNSLYWDFLARNKKKLDNNPRMNLVLKNLEKRDPDSMKALRKKAEGIRKALRKGERL